MIENILILDCETTGLSPAKDKLIEIAVVFYNLKHKTILQSFSTLFPCDENPVEDINGIKAEATRISIPTIAPNEYFKDIFLYADVIVAHNAQFDKGFCDRQLIINIDKPWICTKQHFEWPVPLPRKRLMDICEAMGVEYKSAHRALNDCLLMVECFNKIDDLQERFEKAMEKATNVRK